MLPDRPASDFTLKSFKDGGPEEDFTLSSVKGNWILLLFYPVDFGYVTPTEFYEINKLMPEFKAAKCHIIAISTENLDSQRKWWSAPRHEAGLQKMDNLRFCSDHHGVVSEAYGVYKEDENLAFRATFLLDPDMNVVSIEKCDIPVGLNIGEQLRQVQAALEMEKNPGAGIPAEWQPGENINKHPFIPEQRKFPGETRSVTSSYATATSRMASQPPSQLGTAASSLMRRQSPARLNMMTRRSASPSSQAPVKSILKPSQVSGMPAGAHNDRRTLQQQPAAGNRGGGSRNARSLERPSVKLSEAGAGMNMATRGRGISASSEKRALNN